MISYIVTKIFAVIAVGLLIVSCNKKLDDPGRTGQPASNRPQSCSTPETCPKTGQCDVSPFSGEPETKRLPDQPENSGFFGKKYSKVAAEALAKSSGLATWNSIITSGVPVSKIVVDPTASCRFFAPLAPADAETQRRWKSFDRGTPSNSFLLGLFRTREIRPIGGGPGRLASPAITVREDTERWTLLHEYHHYLFARERVKNHNFQLQQDILRDLQGAVGELESLLNQLERKPRPRLATRAAEIFHEIFQLSLQIDVRGPLEEFAIEGLLINQYDSGLLKYVNESQDLGNAIGYMTSNKKRVDNDLDSLQSNLERFTESIELYQSSSKSDLWQKALSRLNQVSNDIQSHRLDIDQKFARAHRIVRQSEVFSALALGAPTDMENFPTLLPKSHHDPEISRKKSETIERLNQI